MCRNESRRAKVYSPVASEWDRDFVRDVGMRLKLRHINGHEIIVVTSRSSLKRTWGRADTTINEHRGARMNERKSLADRKSRWIADWINKRASGYRPDRPYRKQRVNSHAFSLRCVCVDAAGACVRHRVYVVCVWYVCARVCVCVYTCERRGARDLLTATMV